MKRKTILLSILFLTLMASTVHGQSAIEAVKALKKLEARIGIGLTYKEYALNVADAKVEVSMFLESSAARHNRALADQIQKVLGHYETARSVWHLKVTKMEDFGTAFGHLMSLQEGEEGVMGRQLLQQYPQANKSVEKGGALTMGSFGSRGVNEILVDHMISIIWKEASRELKEAVRMVVR
ncbi:MAG: hypothetical protein CSYNP_03365 [Syntrophus sp. SKADARSKE-3]|nr:hypothetical protein [Syntrophus sp. SKADARSKE-3]